MNKYIVHFIFSFFYLANTTRDDSLEDSDDDVDIISNDGGHGDLLENVAPVVSDTHGHGIKLKLFNLVNN